MQLTVSVNYIIDKLRAGGYTAHVVGGAVRDYLLGRAIGDYDITTSATPADVKRVFSGERIIDTGIKHGTVTLLLDGVGYEITTYRSDGEYKDSRHPESVTFSTNLEDDLSRRDFTVNAMCYNRYDGYTDLFGGMDDLSGRIIRTVGDPARRFSEDALRILRALRFAAVLSFTVEEETSRALRELSPLLSNVSRERIYTELKKLISSGGAYEILSEYSDVISSVIPELDQIILPDRERFLRAGYMARLTSIFVLSKSNSADSLFDSAMRGLRTDNLTRDTGARAIRAYFTSDLATEIGQRKAIYTYGESEARLAVELGVILGALSEEATAIFDRIVQEGLACRVSQLAVSGNDILCLGYKGNRIGEALDMLVIAVIEGRCPNDRDALIDYLENNNAHT